jgi:hypothetical protein
MHISRVCRVSLFLILYLIKNSLTVTSPPQVLDVLIRASNSSKHLSLTRSDAEEQNCAEVHAGRQPDGSIGHVRSTRAMLHD